MNKKLSNILKISVLLLSLPAVIQANNHTSSYQLKSNGTLMYASDIKNVDTFTDMFQQGEFYGRLRSSSFGYRWETTNSKQSNNIISALGGSILYKTAWYKNFSAVAAFYYTNAFFTTGASSSDVTKVRTGHDVINRYYYLNTGSTEMGVLAQASVRYKFLNTSYIQLGRQMVEGFYTKSNDTKIIPNTFEGVVIKSSDIAQTKVQVAYLTKQKLRDHATFHSILAYDDSNTARYSQYNGNDDSAMHKLLTYSALKAAGKTTDAPLIVGDIHNTSIKNLKIDASTYVVPTLISSAMLEGNYKIELGELAITSGMRYLKQFDNGAGAVGGASYKKGLSATGYTNISSLDAQMIAARMITRYKQFKLNMGYTNILNQADLITPWRGFPTGGYTRSMGRYNWMANTQSYRIQLEMNQNKKGLYKDMYIQTSLLHIDADESKGLFDENYYYIGFIQNIPTMTQLQWRLRVGYQDTAKIDADGLDMRFELNYLL